MSNFAVYVAAEAVKVANDGVIKATQENASVFGPVQTDENNPPSEIWTNVKTAFDAWHVAADNLANAVDWTTPINIVIAATATDALIVAKTAMTRCLDFCACYTDLTKLNIVRAAYADWFAACDVWLAAVAVPNVDNKPVDFTTNIRPVVDGCNRVSNRAYNAFKIAYNAVMAAWTAVDVANSQVIPINDPHVKSSVSDWFVANYTISKQFKDECTGKFDASTADATFNNNGTTMLNMYNTAKLAITTWFTNNVNTPDADVKCSTYAKVFAAGKTWIIAVERARVKAAEAREARALVDAANVCLNDMIAAGTFMNGDNVSETVGASTNNAELRDADADTLATAITNWYVVNPDVTIVKDDVARVNADAELAAVIDKVNSPKSSRRRRYK